MHNKINSQYNRRLYGGNASLADTATQVAVLWIISSIQIPVHWRVVLKSLSTKAEVIYCQKNSNKKGATIVAPKTLV